MSYESHLESKKYFDDTATIYNQRSVGLVYDFSSLIFKRRNEIVKKFISPSEGRQTILDYGMGPGVFAKHFTENGFSFIGIDISTKMVKMAQALKLENAIFEVGDVDSLNDYEGKIDYVVAIGLIDYVEEPMKVIRLLSGCVNEDGNLIISFRNRYSLPRILRDIVKWISGRVLKNKFKNSEKVFFTSQHEHSFDFTTQILPVLKGLGFNSFKVKYFNCSPIFFNFSIKPWIWYKWFKIDLKMSTSLTKIFCSGFVVSASKEVKK
mgnify:CR=1 FL=1|tara:strand:- start:1856 stop:2650 length:795 start_codon:yes stop_codon:yes gene_type:complete